MQAQAELKVERTLDSQCRKEWSKRTVTILMVVVTAMKRVLNSNQREARRGKHQVGEVSGMWVHLSPMVQ